MVTPRIIFTSPYPNGYDAVVRNKCVSCGIKVTDFVKSEDVVKWREGAFVQEAFPYLTSEAREALFLSGFCAECWDEAFFEEDD